MMDIDSAERVLQDLTSKLEQQLPAADLREIREYVKVGEWGLAYEFMCTQLEELEVKVDAGVFAALRELGEFGRFDPSVWNDLGPAK